MEKERYTGRSVVTVSGVFFDTSLIMEALDPRLVDTPWGVRLLVEIQDLFPDLVVIRLPVMSNCGIMSLLTNLCDSMPASLLGQNVRS